jgi:hypothetical protein
VTPERPGPCLVGWKEYLDLPELGVQGLKAKVDTGARTSALHVRSLRVLERYPDGGAEVEMTLDLGSPGVPPCTLHARTLGMVRVTDSGGHREVRPVIETLLALGPVRKRIRITLTDRAGMLFRMILGRKALEEDFVVDVARKFVQGRPPRRRSGRR